jgi:hypothetical protein
MEERTGTNLLQAVAERIVVAHLEATGSGDVRYNTNRPDGYAGSGVDLSYRYQGIDRKIKVKPDSYFGTDPRKINDLSLTFYRSDAGHYAFESISDPVTREPGWMFNSRADDLYYYYLAIAMGEEDIRALMSEPDEVFFTELAVDRDELRILPMREMQTWFNDHFEEYPPRPVTSGQRSSWYRLIPRDDVDRAQPNLKVVGPIFARLGRACRVRTGRLRHPAGAAEDAVLGPSDR